MNLIDRMLAPFAPRLVAQRMAAHNVILAYEAAKKSRTHKAQGQPASADVSLQRDLRSLREQSRKLDEDHDLVTGIFDRLEERVVGADGIGVEPIPLDYAGDIHLEFAATLKTLWAEWSVRPEASGELSRPQMERQVCRSWLRDGEMLAQKLRGPVAGYKYATDIPFAIELMEADLLPISLNDDSKGIVQGIERDSWRRVQAYHILVDHPGSWSAFRFSGATKRVEADRIIHIAYRKRIGQSRGLPLLHAVLTRLADIKDYEESERVAARISAALAMYIKKGNPDTYTAQADGGPTDRTFSIGPGMVIDTLLPGEDVGMIESNRPNPFMEGFRNGQLKAVAAGTRGAYSTVARSYDGTFSAQRQELVEAQLGYDVLQHEFIDYWSRTVYRDFVGMALASGRLKVPGTVDPRTIFGAVYQGPVMPWINPKQEADAWSALVKAGFADEAEVARARGRNPQELKRSRSAEVKTNREDGLVFSSDAYHEFYGKTQGAASEQPSKNGADGANGNADPGK